MRIGDYAIIGNCRAAALVSNAGSIDWLCLPAMDSPAVFARLLDPQGGRFLIRPRDVVYSERRYLPDTNVLETRYRTASGAIVHVTDAMAMQLEDELRPEHEILRRVECREKTAEIDVVFEPAPVWGLQRRALRNRGALGIAIDWREGVLALMSPIPMEVTKTGAYGRTTLARGDAIGFSLVFDREGPAVLPPPDDRVRVVLDRTAEWWREWAQRARVRKHRDEVVRSALALKLLAFSPSGAILAAPTTSLPERIGGDLNWDYRYCWPRDAALTIRALLGLGYRDEADAFTTWLLHTTRLTRPRLRVMYDLYGRGAAAERTIDTLEGFASSKPVRVGNDARGQLQLDVYGEVIDAVAKASAGRSVDRETERMLVGFGEHVCRAWFHPDEGIWEPRSERSHHTHSLVSCWVALDRLIAMHPSGAPIDKFAETRTAIRLLVEKRGWSERLQSYVQTIDGEALDASSLLFSWYGFVRPDAPRMRSTEACIHRALSPKPPLLHRYRSSIGEGAFGICSFWAIEQMARAGRVEEASKHFEAMLGYANDVGLYAEEIDPETGEALGNFPQAFTHVGLINAALTIEEAR